METRNQSDFVLVLACFGVVLYHLLGNAELYIGNAGVLSFDILNKYCSANGFFYTFFECIKGSTAIVGVFLINSGYGLYKTSNNQAPINFYRKRFTKIWIYCLLCGIVSTMVVYAIRGDFIYSYIFSLIPIFGFYELPREGFVVQYWYLSLLFIYYLLFPYLKKIMDLKNYFYIVLFSVFIGYLVIFDVYTSTSIYHSSLCRLSEFSFGIFLAKNQKIEKYFFEFKLIKIAVAIIIIFMGYYMFYDIRFGPFSFLFFSVGFFLGGVQIASLFKSNTSVTRLFSKLKGGTMSVYLLHLMLFPSLLKICMSFIDTYFKIEQSYLLSFTLIFSMTFFALIIFNVIENYYYKIINSQIRNHS